MNDKGAPQDESSPGIAELQSEIRLLEQRLRQAQQMEALGALAGGIAHDFNNILSAIIGFSDLAMDELPAESMPRANIDQVLKAGYRAKDLVTQILTFSRQVEQVRQPLQLHLILKETLRLLRSTLPSTIDIRHSIDKHCGPVQADPAQIYQILMNLATNAYQAMKNIGGILELSLTGIPVDEELAATCPDLKIGLYAALTIHDTGCGMDQETMQHIFDPNFTTKPVGEGSGLGLSVVKDIIRHYDGAITVSSQPGKGATFTIYLPQIEQEAIRSTTDPIENTGVGYRILFVDDEETVGEVVRQMLKRLGHQGTILTSSAEALDIFSKHPDDFDLVITDEIMPNLTGTELAYEFRKIRPDMPVVLTTGFVQPPSPQHIEAAGFKACLMKPFATQQLQEVIAHIFAPTA
ncbi:MAG: response regulator [Spartobacteria bacterium]|nr:response regulator [Spartobacteria bacterium]